jgi:hypothetical protein
VLASISASIGIGISARAGPGAGVDPGVSPCAGLSAGARALGVVDGQYLTADQRPVLGERGG